MREQLAFGPIDDADGALEARRQKLVANGSPDVVAQMKRKRTHVRAREQCS
jgi:hypothetical protein